MIIDLHSAGVPDSFDADYCVVGAGGMGLALALELEKTGKRVLVLEDGGYEYDTDMQEFADMEITGLNPSMPPGANALRFFGGSTNHWGGWNRPFEASDCEKWPVSYDEMAKYFPKVKEYLALDAAVGFDDPLSVMGEGEKASYPPLPEELRVGIRHVFPMRVAEVYKKRLADSKNVTIALGFNVTRLQMASDAARVTGLEGRAAGGRKVTCKAGQFVLAAGGLGNIILMLNFNRAHDNKIGNTSGLVGKYYMDHAHVYGDIMPLKCMTPFNKQYPPKDPEAAKLDLLRYRQFWQLNRKLPQYSKYPNHGFARSEFNPSCVFNNIQDFNNFPQRHVEMSEKHTLPTPDEELYLDFAPTPTSKSYIKLTDKPIVDGMYKCAFNWQIEQADIDTVIQLAESIETAMLKNDIARIRLAAPIRERGLHDDADTVRNGCHNMGGLIMGRDAASGVVDSNGKVFGVDNLHVAGACVMPSVGWCGATFTALALTYRMAEKLTS